MGACPPLLLSRPFCPFCPFCLAERGRDADAPGGWAGQSELGVDGTAYGTRWYLTLFNLSIPFAAQLRVWDVFLLLGTSGAPCEPVPVPGQAAAAATAATGLDILHATGAALIQALREVLLDSDFENAMKALTSWIPIKDEDLLMRVAKAEWKTRQSKKKP